MGRHGIAMLSKKERVRARQSIVAALTTLERLQTFVQNIAFGIRIPTRLRPINHFQPFGGLLQKLYFVDVVRLLIAFCTFSAQRP
jgi:hypothetical protein